MTGSPKKVEVNIILENDNPLRFRVEPVNESLPTGPKGKLIFNNDHHPGFHIWFYLKDPNDLGYLFPPNNKKHEAIWSELGAEACPQTAKSEVFQPQRVIEPERDTLVVLNPNPSPAQGAFGYTLRVTKDDGGHYLLLDPGGLNQNGPISRSNTVSVFVAGAVVGAAAGSLATLGAQALLGG